MNHLTADRTLLYAGIAAGLIFFIIPTIEIFRRPGFSIERHAISMLSLGEGGWIMKSVFILCGALTMLCAIGIGMRLAAEWTGIIAAVLIGVYGIGMVIAGIYDAPAGLGFPAGTPIDQQPVMTREANLHGLGFVTAFGSLILSCFVFALYFYGQSATAWMLVSAATGLVLPVLVVLGVSATISPGIAFYWAAMIGWLWLGSTLLRLAN